MARSNSKAPSPGRGNRPVSVASLLRRFESAPKMELPGPHSEVRFCEIHGPYMLSTFDSHGVRRARPDYCARCERQQRLENELKRAAFPARYRDSRFSNYQVTCDGEAQALQAAKEYAAPFAESYESGRNLLLVGKTGTGKTRLACSIGREVIDQGYTSMYLTVRDFLGMISTAWDRKHT